MATSSKLRVIFSLSEEEMKLARQLAKRENREGANTVNCWAREVVRQYLHEYRVMPQAWKKPIL
jgi:hypothetical protein